MVQLLIMYYIILVALDNKILVAVIAFGLNSAAYVAEMSVPELCLWTKDSLRPDEVLG